MSVYQTADVIGGISALPKGAGRAVRDPKIGMFYGKSLYNSFRVSERIPGKVKKEQME